MRNHLAKVRITSSQGVWRVATGRQGEVYRPLDLKRAQAWCEARNAESYRVNNEAIREVDKTGGLVHPILPRDAMGAICMGKAQLGQSVNVAMAGWHHDSHLSQGQGWPPHDLFDAQQQQQRRYRK